MDDPKKLKDQRPDYVSDPNSTGDPDKQPQIGTDPMSQPTHEERPTHIGVDPDAFAKDDPAPSAESPPLADDALASRGSHVGIDPDQVDDPPAGEERG
jgi:hypothetical protein